MTNRLTHFEIYGDDPRTLAAFYRELFGWHIEQAAGVDYWRIRLTPALGGNTAGGVTYRPALPVRGWMQYVHVDSLDASIDAAQRLGAEVLRPKTAIPKTAWYAVLADPEGNAFALWQPDPTAFPLPLPD